MELFLVIKVSCSIQELLDFIGILTETRMHVADVAHLNSKSDRSDRLGSLLTFAG